jgi:hypothetical protein
MSEPTSEQLAADLDQALQEAQRQERADQQSDLDRQHHADDRIVDALSKRTRLRAT